MKYNVFYDLNKIVEKKIIKYSSSLSNKKINILIAYSGGVDSSVLLHVVNLLSLKMNIDYDFVYIDHGMNVNSKHIIRIGNQFASMNDNISVLRQKFKILGSRIFVEKIV